MKIAESIELPDQLELARVSGKLVVFAGAGVSMGPPSNLPGFRELGREIVGAVVAWDEGEYGKHLDFYLGDAERKQVKVQERARAILSGRGGAHTSLHESLTGIFSAPSELRLITTNFDGHFSSAASKIFPAAAIAHYIGPALPPGREFSGIAHLHGSLTHAQDRLVLTDADFGSAYLADGWATRFLLGVFSERTVLFIGYSLTDPVVQYLMRALPRTVSSFAFCHESEGEQWANRNVTPITFQAGKDGDRFSDLNAGLERWRWYAQASPSDHERKLRRLIGSGPPASLEDADYIRARIQDESGRATFLRVATSKAWFEWVASEGILDCLTNPAKDDPLGGPWGYWCLGNFTTGARPPLMKYLRGRPLALHPWFANQLLMHLAAPATIVDPRVRRQLIALLVNTPATPATADNADWLLRRLVKDGAAEEAFALLRWMTNVRLQPIERYQIEFSEQQEEEEEEEEGLPRLAFEIGISVSSDLAGFLEAEGDTIAALGAEQLLAIGIQRIAEAYELVTLARGDADSFDWLSFRRTLIPSTNQDSIPHAEDVLILIVRAALDYWKNSSPDLLVAFGKQYSSDPRALIRRLALYAFSLTTTITGDKILGLVVSEGWFRELLVRPELYLVLRTHYHRASETAREKLISAFRDDAQWGEEFDEHDARARFNLSQLLRRVVADSDATQRFLAAERGAHPDWVESDEDGLLSRTEVGWGGSEPSPIETKTMLGWAPAEAVPILTEALTESGRLQEAFSLQGAIQQAVTENPGWGIEIFDCGLAASNPSDELLEALLWGLRSAQPTPAEQRKFLETVAKGGWPVKVANPLGSVLDKWSRELGENSDKELLDALDEAADTVFEQSKNAVGALGDGQWVDRAINHSAGHAAQVWWNVANARDKVDGRFVLTVDSDELKRWERVLQDETIAGDLARPILGMVSDRLSAGDFPWAEKMLFPAFDPTMNAAHAAQLWDGRLLQHRWSWTTVNGLSASIDNFLAASGALLPTRGRELGDVVALFVANPAESKFGLSRLQTFIQFATPDARRAFADRLPQHLGQLSPDERRDVWNDTLLPYWRDRLTNVPMAFDVDEVAEMARWAEALPELAPEVLSKLTETPGTAFPHLDSVIWEWKQDDAWVRGHPEVAAGLLRFMAARRSIHLWHADDAVELLETALAAGASKETVRSAAEKIVAGTSSQRAADLAARLKEEGS